MKLFGRVLPEFRKNRSCHKCLKPATQEFYKSDSHGQADMSSRMFACDECSPQRANAA